MSIDSVDVGPSRRLYFLSPNARVIRPDSQSPALFFGLMLLSATCLQNGNPELANVINTAQTVTYALV